MTLFRERYRIESTRLKGWDYASDGWYFVTVCVQGRKPFFGDIIGDQIHLSETGVIVADEWQRTPTLRRNIALDEWVVMPNHLHGIILINSDIESTSEAGEYSDIAGTRQCDVPGQIEWYQNTFGPQRNNLAAVIRGFKGSTTKLIHASGQSAFAWQARFYDHIIRDERALERIRQYIIYNPQKWSIDQDNPTNLWM